VIDEGGAMKTREEYVSQLKNDLDRWNAEVAKWETQAGKAKADMKKGYAKQLETLQKRREEALYNLKLVENASATAWSDLAAGADEAWKRMREAIGAAKSHFEKAGNAK
jgi:hypothetical protein